MFDAIILTYPKTAISSKKRIVQMWGDTNQKKVYNGLFISHNIISTNMSRYIILLLEIMIIENYVTKNCNKMYLCVYYAYCCLETCSGKNTFSNG